MSELETKIGTVLRGKRIGEIWSTTPETTVYRSIEMMADKQVGALMVMDKGELVGVLSERDYARKVILQGRSSKDTAVSEIMSTPAICATLRMPSNMPRFTQSMNRRTSRISPSTRKCSISASSRSRIAWQRWDDTADRGSRLISTDSCVFHCPLPR